MTLDTQYHYKSFHQTVVNIYKSNFKSFSYTSSVPSHAKQKEKERRTPAGGLHSPLANEQDTTGPGQSPTQDVFFLTFGETGKAPDNSIFPLGKMY